MVELLIAHNADPNAIDCHGMKAVHVSYTVAQQIESNRRCLVYPPLPLFVAPAVAVQRTLSMMHSATFGAHGAAGGAHRQARQRRIAAAAHRARSSYSLSPTHARTHRTGALTASVRIRTTQITCYSIVGLCSAPRLVSAAVPLESVGIAPHCTASLWVPSSAELAELSCLLCSRTRWRSA